MEARNIEWNTTGKNILDLPKIIDVPNELIDESDTYDELISSVSYYLKEKENFEPESFDLSVTRQEFINYKESTAIVLTDEINTVGDIIDTLSKIPKDTVICPYGDQDAMLIYIKYRNAVFLDNRNFLEENFSIKKDEPDD